MSKFFIWLYRRPNN